jgi:DHA2 family multidrug resistance protein-like MFS transporter
MSKPQQSRWLVLLPLMLAILGGSLANSMTNTALPRIAAALSVSQGSRAWIVGAFPLALAVTMVAAARLGDHYGRRRLMLAGLAVVAVVNIVPAFVSNGLELIACRGVLGVAGAMILASVVSTIGHTFRGHDLAIANGAWVTVFGVGSAAGPIAGGVLTQALGWRSVFLCLSPLAVATAGLAWWLMPESMAAGPRARWDGISLALSVTTVGGLVYGIQHLAAGPVAGALFLAAGAASAVWFVHRQRWLPNPLIDMSLFGRRGFARSATQIVVSAATTGACLYLVSLHLQDALARTPLQAGLALAPLAAATALGGVLAPLSLRRVTILTAVRAALVLQGAGLLALAWSDTAVLVPVALVGLGYGGVGTLATTALFQAATPPHAAQAGAIQEVAFAFGTGAGVAFFGAVADVSAARGFLFAMAAAALLTAASAAIPARRGQAESPSALADPSGERA